VTQIPSLKATEAGPGPRYDKRSADQAIFAGVHRAPAHAGGEARCVELVQLTVAASPGCNGHKVLSHQFGGKVVDRGMKGGMVGAGHFFDYLTNRLAEPAISKYHHDFMQRAEAPD
jgi:hypothetical protein